MPIKTIYDMSRDEVEIHYAHHGAFNDYPPGWRELTAAEFARSSFFTYQTTMVEYRQMHGEGTYRSAHLNWMHDNTGFAIVNDFWEGTIKYFMFGCEHEYGDAQAEIEKRGIRLFSHDHALYCVKCKYLSIHDSSD
jgi:hypothetical protein